MAKELAELEYDKFHRERIRQADEVGGEFEKAIREWGPQSRAKKKGGQK